ncbi:MAG: porin [Burkholderiales bacterium]|nr:porin [Burkholderiales bacterium]
MKKTAFALAALAFIGTAAAQSTVQLWGVMDADVAQFRQGGLSKTMVTSSGNAGSQIGFRGTEDLGGGMAAGYWLEASILNSNGGGLGGGGALAFNRRSTVGLSGAFGEIRLGRDYTPSFINHAVFDPFGTAGVATGSNITVGGGANGVAGDNAATAVRANNSIQYLWGFAPNGLAVAGKGVYLQLMYALPQNASGQPPLGDYRGVRVGYAQGPLNAALSYAQVNGAAYAADAADAARGYSVYKLFNIGAAYDFGSVKLMAHVGTNDSDAPGTKYTHWGLGATVPVGVGFIQASYNTVKQDNATSDGASQLGLGYVYNLSKTTALYAAAASISNKNNGTYTFGGSNGGNNPGLMTAFGAGQSFGSGTGYSVGLRTIF